MSRRRKVALSGPRILHYDPARSADGPEPVGRARPNCGPEPAAVGRAIGTARRRRGVDARTRPALISNHSLTTHSQRSLRTPTRFAHDHARTPAHARARRRASRASHHCGRAGALRMDASRGPILFRCDGTPEQGWEPFYQCLSLAAALQRRRRGTHFFSYLDPLSLAQVVHRANNEWVPAEQPLGTPGDLEATVAQTRRLAAAAVVVAGQGMTAEYLAELRTTGALVVVFDSTAGMRSPADVLVNPFLAPARKAFRYEPGTQLLSGHRFALCRGVFRRQRTIRATEPVQPFRALVALGDDDLAGQAVDRTRELLEMTKVTKVSVAVRTHHPRYEELKDLA